MKKNKNCKWIVKFCSLFIIFVLFIYFFVGGWFMGGLKKQTISPVPRECAEEILRAYHVNLPSNADIISIDKYSWGVDSYMVVKIQGISGTDDLMELNKDNFVEEYDDSPGERINVLSNIRKRDGIYIYPCFKYVPFEIHGTSVLYDDNYVYLSMYYYHVYGKEVYRVFSEYFND